jgi:hypothetical protein
MRSHAKEAALVASYFARFAGAAFCLLQTVDTIKCVGPSMLPTLNRDGDIVLVDKLTPHFRPYESGEVVIARSVSNPRHTVCKRVIAKVGWCILCPCAGNILTLARTRDQEGDTVCVRPRYSSSEVEFHKVRECNTIVVCGPSCS